MALAKPVAQNAQNVQIAQRNVIMVPDDPRARLMYYVNCVGRLLDLQGINPWIDRLQMYNAYIDITGPSLLALMNLAVLLRPANLFGGCLILNDQLCEEAGASFLILEKTEIAHALNMTVDGVKVQGVVRKVYKVMVVKKMWLLVTFYGPFIALAELIKAANAEATPVKESESCACAIL